MAGFRSAINCSPVSTGSRGLSKNWRWTGRRRCWRVTITAGTAGTAGCSYSWPICRSALPSYRMHNHAKANVFDYIERLYNPTRTHSTLGYFSPMGFKRQAHIAEASVHRTGSRSDRLTGCWLARREKSGDCGGFRRPWTIVNAYLAAGVEQILSDAGLTLI